MGTVESLLGNITNEEVAKEPFPHLTRCGAISPEYYAQLERSFPSNTVVCGDRVPSHGNVAVRMSSAAVFASRQISREWKDFFQYHISEDYWRDLVRVFGQAIRSIYPRLEERLGRPLEDFRVGVRGNSGPADVKLECQFVVNPPGMMMEAIKTPHVDKRQTLIAGLFYLRDHEDDTEGGHLELYRWNRSPRFLPYRMILAKDVTHCATSHYSANQFVCFVNSPSSVHGVSPRHPGSLSRRYINLVAEVPHHLFRLPLISLPAAVGNWNAIREIRRSK
ncbi:2OG-Fe(II) oxygenase [Dongia soli]|uniref:Prolyl 4-hydroxylase alpha subunit Fe(2+) 2OG dioxygenase domain-containing protein n=1 Tax=Dongia soli TaxID=600628 RepID=A0ABU5EDU7_9PROT|nr:2OG-Fe(II) oxygenase [Dongia soli]MDY0884530.1 hypothetical protein [Dongia soli]